MKKNSLNLLKRTGQEGFSLIELMIVIAILGLLMGVVAPRVMGSFDKAKVETTRVNMKQLTSVLKTFRLDCGSYPTSEQGLEALIDKSRAPECKNYAPGGYIDGKKSAPKDAWEKEYLYESDGTTFTIRSLGANKKEGGTDYDADISISDTD